VQLDYLFLDASFFRMHPGSPAEPVLAAWGITTDGKPAFIGLGPGTGESFDAWHALLTDLTDRGLASPLLIISDGAAGLIGAIEQAYPKAFSALTTLTSNDAHALTANDAQHPRHNPAQPACCGACAGPQVIAHLAARASIHDAARSLRHGH
jgi:hypothetical protein